jgi:uncharacterized protein YegL
VPNELYVLLDISASMSGPPFEALKQGYQLLSTHAIGHFAAIGVARYESHPREIGPVGGVLPALPALEAGGASNLGRALRWLADKLEKRRQPRPRTLLCLFTDGFPTDDWQLALPIIRGQTDVIYTLGCGLAQDRAFLAHFGDQAFDLNDLSADTIRSFSKF